VHARSAGLEDVLDLERFQMVTSEEAVSRPTASYFCPDKNAET
jgi:hypothetical protein